MSLQTLLVMVAGGWVWTLQSDAVFNRKSLQAVLGLAFHVLFLVQTVFCIRICYLLLHRGNALSGSQSERLRSQVSLVSARSGTSCPVFSCKLLLQCFVWQSVGKTSPCCLLLSGVFLWGKAVAQLPTGFLWPMQWALSWPHGLTFQQHGCISAIPYTYMCLR